MGMSKRLFIAFWVSNTAAANPQKLHESRLPNTARVLREFVESDVYVAEKHMQFNQWNVQAKEEVCKPPILTQNARAEDYPNKDSAPCCSCMSSKRDIQGDFERRKAVEQGKYNENLQKYEDKYEGGTKGRDQLLVAQFNEWTNKLNQALFDDVEGLVTQEKTPFIVGAIRKVASKLDTYCPYLPFDDRVDFLTLCTFGCLQLSMSKLRMQLSPRHNRQLSELHGAMWKYMNNEEIIIVPAHGSREERKRYPITEEEWVRHHKSMNKILYDLLTCGKSRQSHTPFENKMRNRYV